MAPRIAFAGLCAGFLALAAAQIGCQGDDEPLTRDEAQQAVDEAQLSTGAEALTYAMVTLTTDFTLGDAVETGAENLRAFVASQVPCAEVTRVDHTVTVDFGVDGQCLYQGRAWSGRTAVTVARVDGTAVVDHRWTALGDGHLTVDGEAHVTWDPATRTRSVTHALSWTDGEHTGHGEGERTQALLDGRDGIRVDGERRWTGFGGGAWALTIEGVELRGRDPLPQAGRYALVTPADKTLEMTFSRVDARTIEVQVTGGRRAFTFQVLSVE